MKNNYSKELFIFFKRFKDIREDADLSQTETADDLNISREAYGHYERGNRIPNVGLLLAFCKKFSVSADYLLGLTNAPRISSIINIDKTMVNRNPCPDFSDEQLERLTRINNLSENSINEILDLIEFKYQREKKNNIRKNPTKNEVR